MEPIGSMSDRAGGGNRHPSVSIEVCVVTPKIFPILAYVDSMAVWLLSCMGVNPVARNGGGHSRAEVSSDTGE